MARVEALEETREEAEPEQARNQELSEKAGEDNLKPKVTIGPTDNEVNQTSEASLANQVAPPKSSLWSPAVTSKGFRASEFSHAVEGACNGSVNGTIFSMSACSDECALEKRFYFLCRLS